MLGSVTVYFNTGFNGVDIPSSQQVLLSAQKKTYNDVYFMREDIDKPTIRIKDTYENLCAVDYCQITITTGNVSKNSFYFASPSALTKGVTLLALDLDALLTMGGAENLNYISGWQERGHIKKSDDTLFGNIAPEDWCPVQPLVNANMVKLEANSQSAPAEDLHLIMSNVDLTSLGNFAADEQSVIKGVETSGGTPEMYFPKIPIANSTSFFMWDYNDNAYKGFTIPQTRAYAIKNFTVSGNPEIQGTKESLQKLFSCGQLQLQNSYVIPKEFVSSWTGPALYGDVGTLSGMHDEEDLTTMPYEYSIGTGQSAYTPKNKKVFATYRQYAIACVASGDMCIKEAEEIYESGHSYPSINMWADLCSTGKPYCRFSYIKGAPVQFIDCVKGLQWANNQLVMEGASGSLWNSIDNAFANQQLQRQQSLNLFNHSVAAQAANLSYRQTNLDTNYAVGGGLLNTLGNIGNMVYSKFFRSNQGTKAKPDWQPMNELDKGKSTLGQSVSMGGSLLSAAQSVSNGGLELERLYNEMNASAARAEMANNSIQNQINQNNIGLIRSNSIVYPSVMFTPEQNLGLYGYNYFVAFEIRKTDDDLKSEDMYYQRYGYNGLHRPLTQQAFKERTYYNFVQAFDINLKAPSAEFGLRVRTKAIAQLNKGVRVWRVLPDPQYYETN